MQKIYINGRFLSQKTTGVQRYATEILCALDDILEELNIKEFSFELVAPFNAENISLRNIKMSKQNLKLRLNLKKAVERQPSYSCHKNFF